MKNNIIKKTAAGLALPLMLVIALTGCNQAQSQVQPVNTQSASASVQQEAVEEKQEVQTAEVNPAQATQAIPTTQLEVRFGDEGQPFAMNLEDNSTAAAIANYVGTNDWRLPIYNYEDFENSDVMQYYDIPERYEIPSNAQSVETQKAGEVYYSDPNRIVLFYEDAQIQGEYTKIGSFDYSEEFVQAVINNPVLEGWSNKIILISNAD